MTFTINKNAILFSPAEVTALLSNVPTPSIVKIQLNKEATPTKNRMVAVEMPAPIIALTAFSTVNSR